MPCDVVIIPDSPRVLARTWYHAGMKQRQPDSAKTFGLIGLILILTAYIVWGFIMPALRNSSSQQSIDKATQTPVQRHENPALPTGESAMPSRP
jgi:hypothetical protein